MMHLTFATVSTLISGLVLLVGALVKGIGAKDRVGMIAVGGGLSAYAFWGITRTSGTFLYHPLVFAIPILGILYMLAQVFGRTKQAAGAAESEAPSSDATEGEAMPLPPERHLPDDGMGGGVEHALEHLAAEPGSAQAGAVVGRPDAAGDTLLHGRIVPADAAAAAAGPAAFAEVLAPRPAETNTVWRSSLPQMAPQGREVAPRPAMSVTGAGGCARCGTPFKVPMGSCPRCGMPVRLSGGR